MKKPSLIIFFSLISLLSWAQKEYDLGPNSWKYNKIPQGTLTPFSWESEIYKNTIRDYYVYVPAQYDSSTPAALMVFQDGHTYVKEDGHFRVPAVFDNLISQGKMPVTIGLFINPGHDKDAPAPENRWRVTNRSVEYDTVSATYGRFLLEEMIPELKKRYNISDDPKMRAVCGISSGGICAFSVAWFHPENFHRVLSHIGSFTDIKGGHNYPPMIRQTDKKDIKVFLQDGSHDLDNRFGNWWLANQQMSAALKFKGYNYKFVSGEGAHNGNHGGAILPESLEWLWSDVVPKRITSGKFAFPEKSQHAILFSGESPHFSKVELKTEQLTKFAEKWEIYDPNLEQILILKEGELLAQINGQTKTIGPQSVAVVMPGDKLHLECKSADAVYYRMEYQSRYPYDTSRGEKDGGSVIISYDDLAFKNHKKGGRRNYFNRSTHMCDYYEMHVTNLNTGIKSHEPHTHKASEIILMIDGNTEMEIGNTVIRGKKGDVYFLPANIPHAIKNIGDQQCQYFAFQWY